MEHTEQKHIPSMLFFIDFQKAYDTVSWKFSHGILDFFDFGPSIKQWIKVFYTNIKSSVVQNNFLSAPFKINRGVRQGDPISSYLFLICAEILGILIRENIEIKGIKINDVEHKISQFADDTTLILDVRKILMTKQ